MPNSKDLANSIREAAKVNYLSQPLVLTLAIVIGLALLINASFKLIQIKGFLFTASAIICPLVAFNYFLLLRTCNEKEQRHVLNQSLLSLYLFSVLVFVLLNLPASPYTLDQSAYQIVFEDIPRKFFASTLALGFSFYIPHFILWKKASVLQSQPKYQIGVAILGGFLFFTIDFLLLFISPKIENFSLIYWNSILVIIVMMMSLGGCYWIFQCLKRQSSEKNKRFKTPLLGKLKNPWFNYLLIFSVLILLICQSCEYRLVAIADYSFVASGLFFPLCIMASNLIGELYGLRANLQFASLLIITELLFDGLLILVISLPAPDFLNINPFYSFIMPRRILATSLSLLIAFLTNSFLLEELKKTSYGRHAGIRMLVANLVVNSVLCLVNYGILFTGVYAYEQIVNLVFNGWLYKFLITLLGLPLILRINNRLSKNSHGGLNPC